MAEPVCGICTVTRDDHADRQHEFSEDGVLIPKKTPAQKRAQIVAQEQGERGQMLARLLRVLTEKELLSPEEFQYIVFGGPHENPSAAATNR